ncbi:MAG: pilus assembly protein MshD [Methylotenera sp.]|nr:type II secretion system protein [Methylotenera sp.]MDD4926193.1 type II secretion system protein [Methylotenera sp.]NOS96017.1 pilus assembly protein MshD [Methylotenera sp.]NOU40085.1 pilus assembly protein MshD [Methylotenera sp.]
MTNQRLSGRFNHFGRLRAGKLQVGFTLIELVIFIVIVSVAVVGILSVMNTVVKSSADPMVRKQAAALADSILEEILLKPYCDPDPLVTTGETTRDTMDDVSDFNGKSNALFTDLPSEVSAYTINIAVTADSASLGIAAKQATVTVSRGTESVSMTGYRTRYGDDITCAP